MRSYMVRDRLQGFAKTRQGQLLEIISYDVPGHDNRTAVAISHFIFGYSQRKGANGHTKEYRFPGFIEQDGVVWIGQSVFMLTPERSSQLRRFLESRGVAFGRIAVRTA